MPTKTKGNQNRTLHQARRQKKDEFYTQLSDIEKELCHYKKHFHNKVVYCNCDDPKVSNFFKYFVLNFKHFGLKKLITTCYKSQDVDLFSQHKAEKSVGLIYEETERQRDRETERQRDRETERQRDRE